MQVLVQHGFGDLNIIVGTPDPKCCFSIGTKQGLSTMKQHIYPASGSAGTLPHGFTLKPKVLYALN